MKKFSFALIIVLAALLTACSGDKWDGVVFPDRDKLLMYHHSGTFKNNDECSSASMKMLESMHAVEKGFYECGRNCTSPASSYDRGCEEAERGNLYK